MLLSIQTETNPHFHFYVVGNKDQDLNLLHDGKLAVSKLAKEDKKNYIKQLTQKL